MTMSVKVKYNHFSLKKKKKNPGPLVIGARSVHEVLRSDQLMGAPVVTSL